MSSVLGSRPVLVVPSLASKEEEQDASMWPHAGCGAGEEDDMGRVAP